LAEKRYGPLAAEDWLLAIESATGPASAVLWRAGETRDEEAAAPEAGPSAALLPAIDRLLRRAGVGVRELAAFAIAIGPGSFTGLRIGVATLKGLAFGSPAPVAGSTRRIAPLRPAGSAGVRTSWLRSAPPSAEGGDNALPTLPGGSPHGLTGAPSCP